MDAFYTHKVSLKGPYTTPIGSGFRSLNVTLRKKLDLYANVRPCQSIPNVGGGLYQNVNVVTIRENTEGEYSGLEHQVIPGVIENLKIISQKASNRIAKYAFDYAQREGRKEVLALHKASVMKMSDGLFLNECRKVAQSYPNIKYIEKQVDTTSMILTMNPQLVDVMVMPNLYGDIISDLCAGLIGGLGLVPSANIGVDVSVFEAVHGSAPDIAGKNLANPTALCLSAMLKHMGLREVAEKVERAVKKTLSDGLTITRDIGGSAKCSEYTQAVINNL